MAICSRRIVSKGILMAQALLESTKYSALVYEKLLYRQHHSPPSQFP